MKKAVTRMGFILSICACLFFLPFDGSVIGKTHPNTQLYLKLDGIKGDVVDKQYKDWIEITALKFGASISGTGPIGGGGGVSKPQVSEVSLSKTFDIATPILFNHVVTGKHLENAEIVFVETDKNRQQTYMKYKLSEVLITKYDVSDANAGEEISLQFGGIEMTYYPFDEKGNPLPPVVTSYNLK